MYFGGNNFGTREMSARVWNLFPTGGKIMIGLLSY
jgi:hypothetical protein